MRSIHPFLMSAICALAVGGCQSLNGAPTPIESRKEALAHVSAQMLPAAIQTYDDATAETARRKARDRIIRARIYAIDVNYNDFSRSLSTEQKSFVVGSDVLAAGLTGAATLAKSARTKTHLTTYAGFVLGIRGTVDKELYFSKTLPAIIAQMNASRQTVLAKITEGLARPDSDYPLAAGLADLEAYYVAGTLNGALAAISKEAGVQTQTAEDRIASVTTIAAQYDDLSRKLSRYWQPDGVAFDAGHEARMLACVGPRASVVDLVDVIHGTAAQRTSLVACLTAGGATLN
jgi:hypothetical protein